MDKYKDYLAANVLSDGKIVDFRLLSRNLKVHVNLAKQMLYEFHRIQNARKPGSVHAVYCISGSKSLASTSLPETNGDHKEAGGDTVMHSSPLISSMPEPDSEMDDSERIPVTTIALVQEDGLEKVKAEFESITGMYVHSLQSNRLDNIHVLSDCTRQLQEEFGKEDPLGSWKQYGLIHNSQTKRRTGKRPAGLPNPALVPAKAGKKAPVVSEPRLSEKLAATSANEEGVVRAQAGAHAAPVADLSTKKPEPPTIKRERSNLFAAFNKAKEKERTTKTKTEEASGADTFMGDAEDDEDTEDLVPLDSADADEAHRKARAERAQKLKDMMDEDDEGMADVPLAEDEPVEEEEQAAPIDAAPAPDTNESETNVQVEDGRRRGRRRVMKKKVSKDAEGYLVTKEEPAWESFSEDEPGPAAKRAKIPSASAPAATKGKAGPAKKGQGNLMNFFGKK